MAIAGVQDLHAVSAVTHRLQDILRHAGQIKQSTSVEPPLPQSELERDVEHLLDDINETYDQAYKHAAVETAARDLFYSRISSTSIGDPEFVEVWNLLDILIVAGDIGKSGPELSVWLVEELLDSQTTEGCRTVFDYLESRREQLAQKDFHKKNLVFLRSCNELLRRLSRAEDATFCGRVFFFLFQTFPLGDKSSVNLRGEYHVENTTVFEQSDSSASDQAIQTNAQDATPPTDASDGTATPKVTNSTLPLKPGSKAVPIVQPRSEITPLSSTTLYPIFWRLQRSFSEPTRLFRASEFKDFRKGLDATLLKFKKTPTVVQTSERSSEHRVGSAASASDEQRYADNYNPKYLTSKDLFDLELGDLAFQRNILVQSLILLDFLLSLTASAKKKLAGVEHANRSLLYDFTLSEEDTKWVTETRKSIKELFYATPDGRFYDRMVDTILARDKNWVRWKIESCPSIVRDAVSLEEMMDAQAAVMRITKPPRIPSRVMGAMDLGFLDDSKAGGLDSLRDPARYTAPSTETLLDGIRTDELDLEMAMDDTERTTVQNMIQNKTWRLLRTARTDDLGILARIDTKDNVESVFRPAVDTNGDTTMEQGVIA